MSGMELTLEQALKQAIEAHSEGKLQDAEKLYCAILQVQPKHPDANHNLGVLAVAMNQLEIAVSLFKTALEANPSQDQFWITYIDALIKTNQIENAKSVLKQGKKLGFAGEKLDALEDQLIQIQVNSKSKESVANELSIAIELREKGEYQGAQNWLNNIVKIKPDNAEAWSLLSHVYALDNKYDEAEKALLSAIEIKADLPSIYLNQARLLLKKSKPVEALLKAQIGYENSIHDPESWLVLAACLGANQRDAEALALISMVLTEKPNNAEAFANRAIIRLRANEIAASISDLEMALKLKPHLTQFWRLLGSLLCQNKSLSSAIKTLEKAHQLDPENTSFMVDLGDYYRQDKRITEATSILEKAVKLDPTNVNVWINLGTVLQQDGKIDDAQIAYKKALAINPKSAEIFSNLGILAKEIGDWDNALKYFEDALAISPDHKEIIANKAFALNALEDYEYAEKTAQYSLRLDKTHIPSLIALSTSLASQNKFIEASKFLEQAHEYLKNDHDQTSDGLKKLILSQLYKNQSLLLRSLYLQNKKSIFYELLEILIGQNVRNAVIGSVSSRAEIKYGINKPNLFCNDPLKYFYKIELNDLYDFSNNVVQPIKNILNNNRIGSKKQNLLTNGNQTFGNLFVKESELTKNIQEIINTEIAKYRTYFKDSNEGLIKNWPSKYTLYGWLISMKTGGKLDPHMHDNGWISGSIYINIPPKLNPDSGNLVVCIEDEDNLSSGVSSLKKSINVVTGSLCLFPASLLHYTIPFESEEERIVLAFDLVPK
jgi:tetratricopeptide (TPR) repeat protein